MQRTRQMLLVTVLVLGLAATGCGENGYDGGAPAPSSIVDGQQRTSLVDEITTEGTYNMGRYGAAADRTSESSAYTTPADGELGLGGSGDLLGSYADPMGDGMIDPAASSTLASRADASPYSVPTGPSDMSFELPTDEFDSAAVSYGTGFDAAATPDYTPDDTMMDPTMDPTLDPSMDMALDDPMLDVAPY